MSGGVWSENRIVDGFLSHFFFLGRFYQSGFKSKRASRWGAFSNETKFRGPTLMTTSVYIF
jgi:hypothetical protein